jgi:hypothetical protein
MAGNDLRQGGKVSGIGGTPWTFEIQTESIVNPSTHLEAG